MSQFLIALDQMLNTLIGGYADETLSARAWRLHTASRAWRFTRRVIDTLFCWQPEHCRRAYERELHRGQLPTAYRRPI